MSYTVTTKKTWSRILDDIDDQFERWGGVNGWHVDAKLSPRNATKRNQTAEECRVTLHYSRRGKDYAITMGRQSRAVDNLLVVWLILETLRLNDARSYAKEVAEVYRQEFPALPGPGVDAEYNPEYTRYTRETDPMGSTGPYALLYVVRMAPLEVCEAAYRELTKRFHPDVTGSDATQKALNEAIAIIRNEKRR